MPFGRSTVGSHDDSLHYGSAKRNQASGVAALDAGSLVPVASIPVHAKAKHGTDVPAFDSQSDVTGSRALGTVYQNSSSKTMIVYVCTHDTATPHYLAGLSDSANPPTKVVSADTAQNAAQANASVCFMVLPSHYYKVTTTGGATVLDSWIEEV